MNPPSEESIPHVSDERLINVVPLLTIRRMLCDHVPAQSYIFILFFLPFCELFLHRPGTSILFSNTV